MIRRPMSIEHWRGQIRAWRPGSLVPSNPCCHPPPELVTVEVVRDWHLRATGEGWFTPASPWAAETHRRWAHALDDLMAGRGEVVRDVLRELVKEHREGAAWWPHGAGPIYRGSFHAAAAAVITAACVDAFAGDIPRAPAASPHEARA